MNRIGEQFKTNEGYIITIIDYKNAHNVTIQFQDKYKTILEDREYRHCRNGSIKNPHHPSVYGVGYLGIGDYKNRDINGKETREYKEWHGMMQRGFDEKLKERYSTYKDVLVEEWLFNFQNYCRWREQNYYEIEGEIMDLDKDILYKGNKIYSRDTMIFVPHRINSLLINCKNKRGKHPIGVTFHKRDGKYYAQCRTLNNHKHLGSYDTPEEAFRVYKEFKEAYIKEVADEYKDKIPQELYDAMYAWEVEITD